MDAVPALNKLTAVELDIKTAYALHKLTAALSPEIDFFNEQARAIVSETGTVNDDGTATIPAENAAEYTRRMNELLAVEAQAAAAPFTLAFDSGIKLTAGDVANLSPFVNFKEV